MPDFTIAPDATIEDVIPTLLEPKEYVRVVLETMAPCYQTHGNSRVYIGITGEGKMPYHKVIFTDPGGRETLYGAFGGTSRFEGVNIRENTWSTACMTFEQVKA